MHEEPLLKAIQYFGSQKDLADALGVSQQAVNHWLNRAKKVPYLQALKIALYTENNVNLEQLSSDQKELTFLLNHSAFLKGAPLFYLPLDKIVTEGKRCPIYPDFREIPSSIYPTDFSRPILVDSDNKLIACECRLRGYKSIHSKIKVCRLKIKEMLEPDSNMGSFIRTFPMSERVEIGLFIEQELGSRQGRRTDLQLPQNFAEVRKIGETRKIAARIAGFGNHCTYSQAKVVVKYGLPEVIKAMDDGSLAVSKAKQIACLPQEEQDIFMAMMCQK